MFVVRADGSSKLLHTMSQSKTVRTLVVVKLQAKDEATCSQQNKEHMNMLASIHVL